MTRIVDASFFGEYQRFGEAAAYLLCSKRREDSPRLSAGLRAS